MKKIILLVVVSITIVGGCAGGTSPTQSQEEATLVASYDVTGVSLSDVEEGFVSVSTDEAKPELLARAELRPNQGRMKATIEDLPTGQELLIEAFVHIPGLDYEKPWKYVGGEILSPGVNQREWVLPTD